MSATFFATHEAVENVGASQNGIGVGMVSLFDLRELLLRRKVVTGGGSAVPALQNRLIFPSTTTGPTQTSRSESPSS